MKKSLLTLAIGSLLAGSAYAQTSVTLYGIVDQSIRFQTNADAGNHSQTQLTNGAITNSRWGIKGSEALGNNLKAIFQLENGFDPDTGRSNQVSTANPVAACSVVRPTWAWPVTSARSSWAASTPKALICSATSTR